MSHSQSVDCPYLLSDGEDIQQGLGWVLSCTISSIDDGTPGHTAGSLEEGREGGSVLEGRRVDYTCTPYLSCPWLRMSEYKYITICLHHTHSVYRAERKGEGEGGE